ncbi:hypothetical protein DDB_G0276453 [Dictyostelium discoideum AX4]|uniref:Protovillin n=1 Tax=Dictyostelium discoideum TaxID=44689 RepID=VILB_DICDI|nr:hypothetical protein DDB_G0276453 [Dictyostelium discoideum AX4]P36418.1 RecName: Full=Protovillin; AltName: Full=100 kDa actin-binding protein [Dictyostelium discoideum]EAL69180.1 hypothetical protein DDB_G0276453 [Dictyostelium discoideum AX4]CAA52410.1 protovillin [Dictyostelium discoideum]prf//1919264A F actin-capping protein (protovillin) [Dictyostelium discoideum]|eukprot:XP_643085.1 hypothetical protein DDB_G0276453 [Dictyostelium discoideum AX4]
MEPPLELPTQRKRVIPSKFGILKRNAEIEAEKNRENLQQSSCFSHINEIGKEIGLEIWKIIDDSTIQKVPKVNHSTFETNKSYLLLMGQFYDGNMNIKTYNIHFWIGELLINSQETINFCNDRIEELERIIKYNQKQFDSEQFYPEPILYREFQGKEGDIFMSYFKSYGGPRYVAPLKLTSASAAIATAAKQYKLFHLKGRRNIRVKQVDISSKSLNSGDVFVLDCEDFIYQWNGSESSRLEKGKGLDLTIRLRDEKSAKAKIIVMDENDTDKDHPEFWKRLGGCKDDVQKAEQGGDDFAYEKKSVEQIKLYQVENLNYEVHLHLIDPIGDVYSTTQLNAEFCYILDCETELYVWLGKASANDQRTVAMANAMDLLHEDNRPSWTPIIKMTQGSENTLFKDKFKKGSWGEYVNDNFEKKPITGKGVAAKAVQEKINVDALHNPEKYQLSKEERKSTIPTLHHVDDKHRGELKIWHVRNRNKFEISQSEFGLFYNQSCYLVLFTLFAADGSNNSILYYWQGRFSSSEDKGAAALLAKDVGKELHRSCIHVRTVQNKEPNHFLEHFQGRMVVFKGSRPNATTEVSLENLSSSLQGLYHVRGTEPINIHSIQVEKAISSLDSNDSFILVNFKNTISYIWVGKYSDEKEAALQISSNVFTGYNFQLIDEGDETSEFWESLETNSSLSLLKDYYTQLRTVEQEKKTRLFQCSNNSGVFKVFEIHDFSQDDLDSDDVMILDNQKQIFVWVGKESSDTEKLMANETALEYIMNAPTHRRDDPIFTIQDGFEPHEFTFNFHAWQVNKTQQDSYKSKLSAILGSNNSGPASPIMLPTSGVTLKPTTAATPKPITTPTVTTPKPITTPTVATLKTVTPAVTLKPTTVTTPSKVATTTNTSTPSPTTITTFYPLSVLKQKTNLPNDIDKSCLHLYLSDEEFLSTFKMTKEIFQKTPAWKTKQLRVDNGLF